MANWKKLTQVANRGRDEEPVWLNLDLANKIIINDHGSTVITFPQQDAGGSVKTVKVTEIPEQILTD